MADSKFLKYQDTDGDRFPDICDDVLEEVADVSPCPKCIPNPYAITQDWKTQDSNTPVDVLDSDPFGEQPEPALLIFDNIN